VISRLVGLRDRSISNGRWRNARMLQSYLNDNPLAPQDSWPSGSAVERELRNALDLVRQYRHVLRQEKTHSKPSSVPTSEHVWSQVVDSIDALIARAEELKGGPIGPRD
jgi:hypothetical protein